MTVFSQPRKDGGPAAVTPGQITPRELYVLRRAALEVERRRLALQRAEHQLQGLLLRLELRYALLGTEAELDLGSGKIQRSPEATRHGEAKVGL